MKKYLKFSPIYLMALALIVFSCSDDTDDPTPTPAPDPVADFTFEVDDENPLMVTFTNASINHESSSWDFGDGNTSTDESPSHTYAEGGTYTVTLTATNEDGETDEASQEVTVAAPGGGPTTGENILAGGDMDDPDAWNVTASHGEAVEYEFTEDGTLSFSGDAELETLHQIHIWQAIEVEADQEYLLSAHVEGGGFDWAFLEFDIGPVEPVEGEEYTPENPTVLAGIDPDNSKVIGINGFIPCGVDPFEGDIVEVACDGPAQAPTAENPDLTNGRITFSESGTYYFVIKAGVYDRTFGDGVTVHNISLAPIIEE